MKNFYIKMYNKNGDNPCLFYYLQIDNEYLY